MTGVQKYAEKEYVSSRATVIFDNLHMSNINCGLSGVHRKGTSKGSALLETCMTISTI